MKYRVIFIILLVLGFLLRIIGLGARPVGFTWDEAAIGYNAYSLLVTGRDEYGTLAPLIFKSFGDWKPGLYIYSAVPAVRLLGLNEFATRLPSAAFGVLLLPVIYVMTRLLFPEKRNAALLAMAAACVNPWLLQFSRGAWEANLSLLLTTLAAVLYIFSLRRQPGMYRLLSAVFFGLTFWTYQSAKLFTPLLILALLAVYRRRVRLTSLLAPLFVLTVFVLPVAVNFTSQSGRLRVFSVFSYTRSPGDVRQILKQDGTTSKNLVYYSFHSELLDQGRGVLQRYLNHLSPVFLFSLGDWTSLRHSVYKQGYFYLVEIIPLAIGIFYLLSRPRSTGSMIIILWLVLAPLPAALSRDLVSGVRSLQLSLPLLITIGLGLSQLGSRRIMSFLYAVFMAFFVVYYLDFYYIHEPFYSAREWVSPYRQAYSVVAANWDNYRHIYITDELGQPYIFALFYLRYDPRLYQRQAVLTAGLNGDVGTVTGFDKLVFGPVFWPSLRGQSATLTVGGEYELPDKDLDIPGLIRLADISYPNGRLGLRIVGLP